MKICGVFSPHFKNRTYGHFDPSCGPISLVRVVLKKIKFLGLIFLILFVTAMYKFGAFSNKLPALVSRQHIIGDSLSICNQHQGGTIKGCSQNVR